MDLNLTLIGQMITFIFFVWFTMKFVWPPLMKIMEERRKKIADGLAAAEQGRQALEAAEKEREEILQKAKADALVIVDHAHIRSQNMIDEAKEKAREEGEHLILLAKSEIEQQYHAAKTELMQNISKIVIAGAEKILNHEVDAASNERLVNEMVKEI